MYWWYVEHTQEVKYNKHISILQNGEYSRLIWLCNWNITHKDITNFKVIEYSNKIKKILGDRENSTGNYTKKFINSYNESLSMLKMPYKKEALEYLSRKEFATEHSKLFYYSRINNFQETENIISSIVKITEYIITYQIPPNH